jgi:hypothetical protein
MTENIPPVPPAPQPQGYRPYAPAGVTPGGEAPYGPPQQYGQPPLAHGQSPYQPQHQYASYPGQQYAPTGYPGQTKSKPSGYRIAAGIIGIVLGTWILIPAIAGFSSSSGAFLAFLVLLAGLANITAGILLLINQRGRAKWAPVTLLSTSGAAVLLSLIGLAVDYYGPVLLVTVLPLALPIGILLGLSLAREKRGA